MAINLLLSDNLGGEEWGAHGEDDASRLVTSAAALEVE